MTALGAELLDLLMTGEAARICGVDRRTFLARASKEGVLPAGKPDGRAVYERKDVDKIARIIKAEKEAKKRGNMKNLLLLVSLVVLSTGCESYKRLTEGRNDASFSTMPIAQDPETPQAPIINEEVYVTAGQSLMAGNDSSDFETHPNLVQLYGGAWPMRGEGIGFALERAKMGYNVTVIQCAEGGSFMNRWDGGDLYQRCLDRIEEVGKPVKAILFDQGQEDAQSGLSVASWKDSFERMVGRFRSDLNQPNLPVAFVELGAEPTYGSPYYNLVKDQQRSVNLPLVTRISTDGLPSTNSWHTGREVYREVGRRILSNGICF